MFESFELSALLISILAGLFLGVPSGPALFFVLDTCLKVSKSAALKVYAGLMGSKLLYIALALLANDFISTHQKLESVFYLIASCLLMLWGIVMIIKSNQTKDKRREFSHGSYYRNGFIVGLSNPVIPFVYLTFLQFIKIYARDVNILKYLLNIAIMEAVSFMVLAVMATILLSGGRIIQTHWNKMVGLMGIFLFCAGSYQVYHLVDFTEGEGISIKSNENVLEKQLEKVEEKTDSKPPN
jgi:threonine/homoserine/homoserine lactone efflux protein